MCGIVGQVDLHHDRGAEREILDRMADRLYHRGPDDSGLFVEENVGLGFRRLSIIDLETGNQPIFNEDRSLVCICNGEIFNYVELRAQLEAAGHVFYTRSDVEVLVHLYEEHGRRMVEKLNGQFAFAVWDRRKKEFFLARDHFGVIPIYYTLADGLFIFASEIKALLEHPLVERRVDLTGLDQTLTFPGLVSPSTMFEKVHRLKSGHFLTAHQGGRIDIEEYWDLDYPREGEIEYALAETDYVEELRKRFEDSVRLRLRADVPVGFYLSGGLDSSLIAALASRLFPDQKRHAFAISFRDRNADESQYQRLMASRIDCELHEIVFDWKRTSELIDKTTYHAECPVKETYNTCSYALSEAARAAGIKVILTGEGADELFAGYVGYRFDQVRAQGGKIAISGDLPERRLRAQLWGDPDLFYEHDYHSLGREKQNLYSRALRQRFRDFDCLRHLEIKRSRLRGRHRIHQRSYLDFKLRMSDHLLTDHGDRMCLANSVEARYPFLDVGIASWAARIPPTLKLRGMTEKYILRAMGEGWLPEAILRREKFGWFAPGSPELLQAKVEWIQDVLSSDLIARQGYFDPERIEMLRKRYSSEGFKLNLPYERDELIVVATFGVFLRVFEMPSAV